MLELLGDVRPDVLVLSHHPDTAVVDRLLRLVAEQSPTTVRVVQHAPDADDDPELRPAAHLGLPDPATNADVERMLLRASAMRGGLDPGLLDTVLRRIDGLPGVPAVWAELTRRLDDPEVPVGEVAGIIGRDIALTAEVLRQANAAHIAGPREISDLDEAVVKLGFSLIRLLVLNAETARLFDGASRGGLSVRKLSNESLECAALAASLVTDRSRRNEAFIAGMLMEVGQLVLASALGEDYRTVRDLAKRRSWSVQDAEAVTWGVTHAEVGAQLLLAWGLPESVVLAAARHHRPADDDRRHAAPAHLDPTAAAVEARARLDDPSRATTAVLPDPVPTGPAATTTPRRRRRTLRADRDR